MFTILKPSSHYMLMHCFSYLSAALFMCTRQAGHVSTPIKKAQWLYYRCKTLKGHTGTCSELQCVTQSMSHSAHSVTSQDLGGKQDVRKANSDERAILGMKMKKRLESMFLVTHFGLFHWLCFFFFFNGSFWTSDESEGEQMSEQEVYMNHQGEVEAYGLQGLGTGCNVEALKSVSAPWENFQNELFISAFAAAGCERHYLSPE